MKCPKCHKEVEKGSLYCPYCLAEIPWVREFSTVETLMKKEQQNRPSGKKTENKNYKIFQASKKKKAEIQQKTASMSASVCGDTAGVLLLSAVKYFFCLIFQGEKNNMHSKTMKKHSGLQKMLWIKIPKMKPPIFFWPKVWRNQAINNLHFLFCAHLSRTKLREQEYIKSM
mgnify:CR=1 FL=1